MIGRWLTPSRQVAAVTDLDPQALRAAGVRGVILDLDNTLIAWGAGAPSAEVLAWVSGLAAHALVACILSNGFSARVAKAGALLGVPVVATAGKPGPWGFRRAMAVMGTAPRETALVGDQLFTDVLGGNLLGLYTVLVEPLSTREFVTTRVVRRIERFFRRRLAP